MRETVLRAVLKAVLRAVLRIGTRFAWRHRLSRTPSRIMSRDYTLSLGASPIMAVALHPGHLLSSEAHAAMALSSSARRREEDPFTDRWVRLTDTRVVVHRSRFEVDLNRPRERAVYIRPEDAWGLQVWQTTCPDLVIQESLRLYDTFYRHMAAVCDSLAARHGSFVVYDLHSYNHRRQGPQGPPAPAATDPEINIGTGTMNRARWAPLIDGFIHTMRTAGDGFDVRENVRFQGGAFAQWVHARYPNVGCVLSIEAKKLFMDEWTGVIFPERLRSLHQALRQTRDVVRKALAQKQDSVA